MLHVTVLAFDEHLGLDVARLLFGIGCDRFGRNKSGRIPLRSMGWVVETLYYSFVSAGTDMCSITVDGNGLIHAGMMSHNEDACLEISRHLVCRGYKPSRNREGKTALHIAAERGIINAVWYILALNQSFPDDILFSMSNPRSPGPTKRLMLCILIDQGTNIHATVHGDTLLHTPISSFQNCHFSDGYFEYNLQLMVRTLVDGEAQCGCTSL